MKRKPCCQWFTRGMAQILSALKLREVVKGLKYEAPAFKYCPWCGKELKNEQAEA